MVAEDDLVPSPDVVANVSCCSEEFSFDLGVVIVHSIDYCDDPLSGAAAHDLPVLGWFPSTVMDWDQGYTLMKWVAVGEEVPHV